MLIVQKFGEAKGRTADLGAESKLRVAVNSEAVCASRIRRVSECQVAHDMGGV